MKEKTRKPKKRKQKRGKNKTKTKNKPYTRETAHESLHRPGPNTCTALSRIVPAGSNLRRVSDVRRLGNLTRVPLLAAPACATEPKSIALVVPLPIYLRGLLSFRGVVARCNDLPAPHAPFRPYPFPPILLFPLVFFRLILFLRLRLSLSPLLIYSPSLRLTSTHFSLLLLLLGASRWYWLGTLVLTKGKEVKVKKPKTKGWRVRQGKGKPKGGQGK